MVSKNRVAWATSDTLKKPPLIWGGFGLALVIATCAIVPACGGRLAGAVAGGVVVATLSATACVGGSVVGASGGVKSVHIVGAVRGVAKSHRRITVHHSYQFLCFLYLNYSTQITVCQAFFNRELKFFYFQNQ